MRINVIGTSGSGKTTFGRDLADILNIPFVEMDAIFWGPEWTFPEDDKLFRRLAAALEAESWVLDGNYTRTLPIKWERVDIVIWLDFSFPRTLYQALARAITRVITKEELWPGTGNKESFRMLLSRESIVWWTIKTHRRNRKKFFQYLGSDEFSFIKFIRLRSPAEAQALLQKISNHQEWILE
jgi:adenylate kinase family enzyme